MKKKVPLLLLIFILLLAAFMRLYRISDYLTFLGDEGRDALVVKGILEGHLTLLGPRASAGDFFTGPIYYYMMAPFLWLFHFDPVGPAVMVALFGVATVYLLYIVGKDFFNKQTGLIAAALYAVSPLVINYSRSSWNPNTVPFFSLLTVYVLYKGLTTNRSWKYFVGTGILLGIDLQLHYISLFLAIIVAVSLFGINWYLNKKIQLVQTLKYYGQILLGFLIGFSSFLAFEVRHNFQNTKAIFAFITTDSVQKGYQTYHAFYQPLVDVFFRLFGRLVFYFPSPDLYSLYAPVVLQIFGGFIVLISVASLIALNRHKNKAVVILLATWLALGVFFFGFYKKPIYDYYLVFSFPLPFLLIGNLISQLSKLHKKKMVYGMFIAVLLFLAIFLYNFRGIPFRSEPNRQKEQARHITEFVISKSGNLPFNFALITPGNSDHAYRYYLEVLGHRPVMIDTEANDQTRKTVTDQLLVVCEDKNCKPEGNPGYEVAGFGVATTVGSWDLGPVKVYKLVHKSK